MKSLLKICLLLCLSFLGNSLVIGQTPFITTWQTDNPGSTCNSCIEIPTIGGGYNYDVDIDNDGIFDTLGINGNFFFNFGSPGIYTIGIRGDFPRIYFNNQGDNQKILSVDQWGDIQWQSMERAFAGCSNLNGSVTDNPELSNVLSMRSMFLNATAFNQDIGAWDVSNITDFLGLFSGCSSFNQDIGSWDVSSVTVMQHMFFNATSFNQPLNSWNTSSLESIHQMFEGAISFNQDLDNWDVTNVTSCQRVFNGASSFNGDISSWVLSSATGIAGMFGNATSFNGDITNWDVSGFSSTMSGTFSNATSFNQDLSSWDLSNATSLVGMFDGAVSFNQDLGSWILPLSSPVRGILNNSGLSCDNYSNTLIGWANNPNTPSNKDLGPLTGMEYAPGQGAAARQILINNGWTFNGDVQGACSIACTLPAGQQEDYDALIALYNSTIGDNWTNNGTNANPQSTTEGWNKDCDYCNWYGIQCDGNGRVTEIDLDINQLSGQLPNEIGMLSFLEFFSLRINQLSGGIPSTIGDLVNIKVIQLNENMLAGSLPPNVSNLNSLETLTIPNNQLIGPIPPNLGNVINLRFLELSNNQLSMPIPTTLGNLTNLEGLLLNGNSFSGNIPSEIGNLGSLFDLLLNDNNLEGCLPSELQNLCGGTTVNISNNPLLDNDDWATFCASQAGICSSCPTEYTITYPTEICEGAIFDFVVDILGGVGPYDINIVDGTGTVYGQITGVNSATVNIPADFVSQGVYTFDAEIIDNGSSCMVTRSSTSSADLTAFAGGAGAQIVGMPLEVCFNTPIEFELTATPSPTDNPPYTYSFTYDINNGTPTNFSQTSFDNPFIATITPTESGGLSIYGYGVIDNSGCTYNGPTNILMTNILEEGRHLIFPGASSEVCEGEAFDIVVEVIGGSPPYTIELFEDGFSVGSQQLNMPGFVTFSLTAGFSGVNTYTASISDALGCSFTDQSTASVVTVTPNPIPEIIGSEVVCENELLTLSLANASQYTSYLWSTGDTGPEIDLFGDNGGPQTYSVTVTDDNGCTGEIFTEVDHVTSVQITEVATTNATGTNSDGSAEVTFFSGAQPWTIAWDGPVSGSEESFNEMYTISDLPIGTYSLTVTDGNGCSDSNWGTNGAENTFTIASSSCTHPDVPTLLSLFGATNGVEWTNQSGWSDGAMGSNCDPCGIEAGNSAWYGVSCNNNRVTQVELPNNSLEGVLPSIAGLDSLAFIDLNTNNLTGDWNFTNPKLYGINISNNPNLKTTLPNFNLPELEQLVAFGDSLVGPLPVLDGVPKLRELYVYNNEFNTTIPDWRLDSLTGISLFNSKVNGPLPELSTSSLLEQAFFNFNDLAGEIPPYYNLPNLRMINLDNNDLSGCMDIEAYCSRLITFDFTLNPKMANGGVSSSACGTSFMEVGAPCDDGDANTQNDSINVDCACVGEPIDDGMRPFVTTWYTGNPGVSDRTSIRVPTFPNETYNYEVDWDYVMGDPFMPDTAEISGDFEYDFGRVDTVTIAIRGDFPRIYFANTGDKDKILSVDQWGDIQWQSMESAFRGCVNLNGPIADNPDLSSVTDMRSMFSVASAFNQDIGGWDVSSVTHMTFMFGSASAFNQDVGDWDVSNVTDMSFMFNDASSFNQHIGDWDVSSVIDMSSMFDNSNAFDQNLGNWNITSVEFLNFPLSNQIVEGIFDNSGLSCSNYSATLDGWANNPNTPDNLQMQALGMRYNELGKAGREILEAKGWTITGDTLDIDCSTQAPCPQLSCRSQENIYFDVGNSDTLSLQTVLFNYSPDCGFSFDPNQAVDGLALGCEEICTSPEITIYDITNDTSCTVTVQVRDQNETCGTYTPIIPTIRIGDVVYDGSGFVEVEVRLDDFQDVLQYNFYMPFDTDRLEYVSATYENPNANLRLRLSNNVPVDFVRFTNPTLVQVLNLPGNTLLATLRFRVLDPLICEDIPLTIDDNVGLGTDILNCYVDLLDPNIEGGSISIAPEMLDFTFSDSVLCSGDDIDLTIGNINAYASVELNDSEISSRVTSLSPSSDVSYTVRYTAPSGCQDSVMQDIVVVNRPSFTFTTSEITICRDTVLDMSALVTGSAGIWDTDAPVDLTDLSAVDFTSIAPGTYDLTYTTSTAVAPCIDTSATITLTIEDCDDECCTSPVVFINSDELRDTTLYSVADLPTFAPALFYSNGLTDDCLEEGEAEVTRTFPGGSADCGGQVVETWSYTSSCGSVITHTRTITIEIVPPTWQVVPVDTQVICGEEQSLIQQLAYDNNRVESGVIRGEVSPIIERVSNPCDESLLLSWTHRSPDDCYDSLYVEQLIEVVDTSTYFFEQLPDDVTIDYTDLPLPDMSLLATKGATTSCPKDTIINPVCLEDIEGQEGFIICTWTFDDPCSDQTLNHAITITVENCVLPALVDDEIRVLKNRLEEVDLLDNDNVPDSFSIEVISISQDLFSLQELNEEGIFTLNVNQNFFEPIQVTYEVCNLSPDCEGRTACSHAILSIYDEEFDDVVLTNLFSPNGDGVDEELRFTINPVVDNSELWIYNRWGDQIYHKENYTNDWDASGYPGGVYFYVLRVNDAVTKQSLTILK